MFGQYTISLDVHEDDDAVTSDRDFQALKNWIAKHGDRAQAIVDRVIDTNHGDLTGSMLVPVLVLGNLELAGIPISWELIEWRGNKTEQMNGYTKYDLFSDYGDKRWLSVCGESELFVNGMFKQKASVHIKILFIDVKSSLLPKETLNAALSQTARWLTSQGLRAEV